MVDQVFARVRLAAPEDEGEGEGDPFEAIAALFTDVYARLDAIAAQRNSRNGRDGTDGNDGRGVSSARIDAFSGHLFLSFTDGTEQDCGRVVGAPAEPPQSLAFERDQTGRIVKSILK